MSNRTTDFTYWKRSIVRPLLFGLSLSLCSFTTTLAMKASAGIEDVVGFRQLAGGIDYYVERRGYGPPLVMVASGQGDAGAYKLMADALKEHFTVYTFDQPGFSRSGPPPTWEGLSTTTLSEQVLHLVEALGLEDAHFYGSSSGGMIVLALAADHPEIVRSAVVHEPALVAHIPQSPFIPSFAEFFATVQANMITKPGNTELILDPSALKKLGDEYLQRRAMNTEIWKRRYVTPDVPCCKRKFSADELRGKPVTITVGMFTAGSFTAAAEDVAALGQFPLVWIPTKHSPYITRPAMVANLILEAAGINAESDDS